MVAFASKSWNIKKFAGFTKAGSLTTQHWLSDCDHGHKLTMVSWPSISFSVWGCVHDRDLGYFSCKKGKGNLASLFSFSWTSWGRRGRGGDLHASRDACSSASLVSKLPFGPSFPPFFDQCHPAQCAPRPPRWSNQGPSRALPPSWFIAKSNSTLTLTIFGMYPF